MSTNLFSNFTNLYKRVDQPVDVQESQREENFHITTGRIKNDLNKKKKGNKIGLYNQIFQSS